VKKSRGLRWVECVAYLAERRVACMVLVGKPEGHRPLGELDIDGEIILKRSLQEMGWGHGMD